MNDVCISFHMSRSAAGFVRAEAFSLGMNFVYILF